VQYKVVRTVAKAGLMANYAMYAPITKETVAKASVAALKGGGKLLKTSAVITAKGTLKTAKITLRGVGGAGYAMSRSENETVATAGHMLNYGKVGVSAAKTAVYSTYKGTRSAVYGIIGAVKTAKKAYTAVKAEGFKKAATSFAKVTAVRLRDESLKFVAKSIVGTAKTSLPILLILVVLVAVCGQMASTPTTMGAAVVTSFLSPEKEIKDAESYMKKLEANLKSAIDNVRTNRPSFDVYNVSTVEMKHDPYALTAFLSARFLTFEYGEEVRAQINSLFSQLYNVQYTATTDYTTAVYEMQEEYIHGFKIGDIMEMNGRKYEITAYGDGIDDLWNYSAIELDTVNPTTGEPWVEYFYLLDIWASGYTVTSEMNTLTVTVTANSFNETVRSILSESEYEHYLTLLETKGNNPSLF
jgi:hypothetical protein